ncbi:MAG: DUF2079 domain-containing protein [Oscillospiraceae bacterium]|nr:DUF2079 domain-containing protein [Oscillospiraceae bacterium]MDD4413317.1 DUF2079 domain-containing protein [Oscillospiraceae bacterium]
MKLKFRSCAEKLYNMVFKQYVIMRIITTLSVLGIISIIITPVGFDTIGFVTKIDTVNYLLSAAIVMLSLSILARFTGFNSDVYALAVSVACYVSLMASRHKNIYFSFGLLLFIAIVGYYLMRDDKLHLAGIKFNIKNATVVVSAAAIFFVIYVGGLTTLRYLNYSTSTYDMGIFSQMFYYMKETFLPYTTCERSKLLSHFAVHLSPLFYVLLPGYFVFPSPIYLQIMQAVVAVSAVIPLLFLARRNGLSNKVSAIICISFCFHPALAGSCFYDIHENMFLTPLILWTLYFIDNKQWKFVYLFALLTCLVKEDAAFYVACIALYLFFSKKEFHHGCILFCCSVIYFLIAILYLNNFGDGAMIGRYGNYISNQEWGLLSALRTVILNPAYLITQVFVQEKVIYMTIMLLPVAFLPLLNRKLSQLVLLFPFLVINLLSNYPYQHSIYFQYNFGTLAFFYYLVILNIPHLGKNFKKFGLTFMTAASVILFISQLGGYTDNISNYINKRSNLKQINMALEAVPEDASVRASGYFVPKLSSRKVLYDIHYSNDVEEAVNADYIAIDMSQNDSVKLVEEYKNKGYETVNYNKKLYWILKRSD